MNLMANGGYQCPSTLTRPIGDEYTGLAGKAILVPCRHLQRNRTWFAVGMKKQHMTSLVQRYVQEPVWAVVGASNDPAKYGNRIYLKLRTAGYRVYPVNRRERLIEGDAAYSSLLDLPEQPAVVNMVVPPQEAPAIVQQAKAAGAQAVWFQPGAENAAAIRWAQDHGMDVIESCILVQLALRPSTWEASSDPPPDRESRVPSPDPTTSTG